MLLHCCVEHPDGLHSSCQAEFFKLPDGKYVMEVTRMRGDPVLFALVFELLRTYLATGATPELFRGQLLPRHRRGPANGPATVHFLELPTAS